MKRYLTGISTTDYPDFKAPPYRGLGWSIELDEIKGDPRQTIEVRTTRVGKVIEVPSKELVICTTSEVKANHAMYLILAAAELWDGYCSYHRLGFDPVLLDASEVPVDQRHARTRAYAANFCWAAQIAAKASRRIDHVYALTKWKLSAQTFSEPSIRLDPNHTPTVPKPKHVSYSVAFAYAMILAYSVIEQLQLEIRSSVQKPRNKGDAWNPEVKEELEKRLLNASIDLSETCVWMIRGSKTLVEKNQPKFIYANATKAPWSRGDVRDKLVEIPDAIAHASWLRNCVSAHYLKPENAKVLSIYDVANVQGLAKRLLLETLGFWKKHPWQQK